MTVTEWLNGFIAWHENRRNAQASPRIAQVIRTNYATLLDQAETFRKMGYDAGTELVLQTNPDGSCCVLPASTVQEGDLL